MRLRRNSSRAQDAPLTRRERAARGDVRSRPGLRRFALGLGAAVVLVGLVVSVVAGMRVLPAMFAGPQLRTLVVEGELHHVSVDEVRQAVADDLHGQGFFRVDLDRLQHEVEAMPWVASASVRRSWPHTLAIRVVEQVPVAAWNGAGLVNASGEVFIAKARTLPPALPELAGPEGASQRVWENFEEMSAVVENDGLKIRRLALNPRGGWRLLLDDGIQVRLGRDDTSARLGRFAHVVVQALNQRLDQIDYVDMRYTNGFAVGWKAVAGVTPSQHGEEVPDV